MVKRVFLALVLVGLSSSPLLARKFYMSNAGTDNAAGSVGAPWATLGKANATMMAGDTLYLRGGVYSGVSGINWSKSGAVNSPVVISAYPGEQPVFNGNGATWLLLTEGSQYTVINGLEVTNYTAWAVQVAGNSSYLTIRNCYLHNILGEEDAAIVLTQCDHITIENCVLEEMGRSLTQTLYDHAVYNAAGSHDITIRNNYFKNNYGGPAINHYHTPAPYNVYIYNNVFLMTIDRIGIVVFFSTTPCDRLNSRTKSALLTVNSIHYGSYLFRRYQMSTKKNRFHRACANVEDHLNYTKFSHFSLRQVVDRGVRKEAKIGSPGVLAQISSSASTSQCGKKHNLIAMFPLDCE